MSLESAKKHLAAFGAADRILEFPVSSATVALAAKALECRPEEIAKSLAFWSEEGAILVVAAGDVKTDNAKFKATFHTKAKMLTPPQVEEWVGHTVGGVCPFGVKETVSVYLDVSLERLEWVYPACGSSNSAIRLTVEELRTFAGNPVWVDVCKPIQSLG